MKNTYLWDLYCQTTQARWERFWATFWSHVDEQPNGCKIWTGDVSNSGYACCKFLGKTWMVHRLAWSADFGPIPKGMHIHHLCGQPLCLNVAHLEIRLPGKHSKTQEPKRFCKYGHEFTPENTRFDGKVRWCRACGNNRRRRALGSKPLDEVLCAEGTTLVPYLRQTRRTLGIKQQDLAQSLGITVSALWYLETHSTRPKKATVQRLVYALGVDEDCILGPVGKGMDQRLKGVPKGEDNHSAKVTVETVKAIRQEHAQGVSCDALAKKYGLSYMGAYHIIRRQTWKYVN